MTRRPLVHGPIFETIPPPKPFRVADQRLYVVVGRETERLVVRDQRLYMINDFSSVVDYRYWRIVSLAEDEVQYTFGNVEFRSTLGGADQTGSGTAFGVGSMSDTEAADCFDNDATVGGTTGLNPEHISGFGYDFGDGNEIEIVQVSIQADDDSLYRPFKNFEIQASVDGVVYETKKIVSGEPDWSTSETRTFDI